MGSSDHFLFFFLQDMIRKRALSELAQEKLHGGRGEKFRRYLLGLFATGKVPSSTLAEMAHFATQAGATGVEDLAVAPGTGRRDQSRRVEKAFDGAMLDRRLAYVGISVRYKGEAVAFQVSRADRKT